MYNAIQCTFNTSTAFILTMLKYNYNLTLMEQPTDACERTRHFVWKIVHYCDQIVCMALHACWRRVIVFAAVIQMWVLEIRGFAFFSSFVLICRALPTGSAPRTVP